MRSVVHVLTSLVLTISLVSCATSGGPDPERNASPATDVDRERPKIPADRAGPFLDHPGGTPFRGTPPRAANGAEIRKLLQKSYPKDLLEDGIGGRTVLWIHVGRDGRVDSLRVKQPSSHPAFDEAVKKVARELEFAPALLEETAEPVAVWIQRTFAFSVPG